MKNEVSPRLCAHRCLEKLFGKSSGVVGWRTLPSMKRSYQTDLTDAEWEALKPHLPAPKKRGRPRTHSPREILDAIFYILKSGCPWRLLPRDLERPGRPSTGGLADGERTEPSSGSTPPCASVYGPAWAGTHYLARASPIRKRPRVPESAGSRGATMATRRSGAESGTCSWTRRAWCSKPRYTARRYRTRMG